MLINRHLVAGEINQKWLVPLEHYVNLASRYIGRIPTTRPTQAVCSRRNVVLVSSLLYVLLFKFTYHNPLGACLCYFFIKPSLPYLTLPDSTQHSTTTLCAKLTPKFKLLMMMMIAKEMWFNFLLLFPTLSISLAPLFRRHQHIHLHFWALIIKNHR